MITIKKKARKRRALAKKIGADVALDSEEQIQELTEGEEGDRRARHHRHVSGAAGGGAQREDLGTVCLVGEGGDVTLDVSRDMLRRAALADAAHEPSGA